MELKKEICRAFCDGVQVSPFKGGIAISTPYANYLGDKIGMYVLGPEDGPFRIIDNALTVPFLEAEGATLDTASRKEAFNLLLSTYGADFDEEMEELFIDGVSKENLPRAILDFSALLLRMNDMLMLTRERVDNTFREDVREALRTELSGRAHFVEDEPVSDDLADVIPDMVFFPENRDPVALFLASNESKLWQAIHLRMAANYEAHKPLSVVAMLESDTVGNARIRTQADNRLDAVPRYKGANKDAVNRVVTEVLGRQAAASLH